MYVHVLVYTYRNVYNIAYLRAFTWLLGTTSSYKYQDIMGYLYLYYSWIFPGASQYGTDTGSVNALYYDQVSPVSGGDS